MKVEREHGFNAALWVSGAVAKLIACGVVDDNGFRLTPKGIAEFDQLHASGFRPSVEEIFFLSTALCKGETPPDELLQAVAMMAMDDVRIAKAIEQWEEEDANDD